MLYRFDGIAHRHAQAAAFKHRQVVDAVADAQNLSRIDPQLIGCFADRDAFVRLDADHFDIAVRIDEDPDAG